jgi:hypothetical protein
MLPLILLPASSKYRVLALFKRDSFVTGLDAAASAALSPNLRDLLLRDAAVPLSLLLWCYGDSGGAGFM